LITSSRKADAPSVAPASSQPSSHELLMLFSSKFEKTLQARMEELKKQLDDHTAESQYGKQEKCRRERKWTYGSKMCYATCGSKRMSC
jgi:hypothetical protein